MSGGLFGSLATRPCPICGSGPERLKPFLERRIDQSLLGGYAFASRKTPEFMRHRLVRCLDCRTVYAPEIPRARALASAYGAAQYDSTEEARYAAQTYADALESLTRGSLPRGGALEVGSGTGAFLAHLQRMGFAPVTGVEPSRAAIAAADEALRPLIREGVFDPADFQPQTLSLVCCFQTLEHIIGPEAFLTDAFRLLAHGGMMVLVTHDYSALLNRLLGRFSPIIDIEHLQLFCPTSLRYGLQRAGYRDIRILSLRNRYPLQYWLRLLPLPAGLKTPLLRRLAASAIGRAPISLNVGNILAIGTRP